jgi:hypothetical protein
MLAGEGATFLYTAISRCKVPPVILSIYIVIWEEQGGIEDRLGRCGARAAL